MLPYKTDSDLDANALLENVPLEFDADYNCLIDYPVFVFLLLSIAVLRLLLLLRAELELKAYIEIGLFAVPVYPVLRVAAQVSYFMCLLHLSSVNGGSKAILYPRCFGRPF